jgi:exopolysaccharide biosynthesis polyprenyl glycosylphosphotransferase
MSDASRSVTQVFNSVGVATASARARRRPSYRPRAGLFLLIIDIVLVQLSINVIILLIKAAAMPSVLLMSSALGLIASNGLMGLYVISSTSVVDRFRRRLTGACLFPLFAIAIIAFYRIVTVSDCLLLGAAAVLVVPLELLAETCVRKAFPQALCATAVIVGSAASAANVAAQLVARPEFGIWPVGLVSSTPELSGPFPWLGREGDLVPLIRQVDVVVLVESAEGPTVSPLDLPASRIVLLPDFQGIPPMWTRVRNLGLLTGLEFVDLSRTGRSKAIKRILDLCMAVPMFVLSLPLVLILALAIKLVSRGPAFFVQHRIGMNGVSIAVHKLRSMYVDADIRLDDLLKSDAQARYEWDTYVKLRHDPRILPYIGALIRKTSLDELPQLWDIIRGDLSLVGPRPFPAYHTTKFSPEFQALRASVKPGLTGLWQVSDRSDADLCQQEAIDTFYIRNWSLWLDAHILMRTVPALLFARGAR